MLFRLLSLGLLLCVWLTAPSMSQPLPLTVPFEVPGVTYDAAIPTPDAVMGHRIGSRHTRPEQIVDYFEAVSAASDRVVMGQYATTYEGRPVIYAIVTSPSNHARLDDLRTQNLRLSDDPANVSDADLAAMPAVVHMHYTVHGNESSGSEAALLFLYHLAAGSGEPVQSVLDSVVVILDPVINPDGRDRFVDWANGNRGGVATRDGQDREHNEPWPGGRTNHYWFDLNRDWMPMQHPESMGRLNLFHMWRPQLLVDVHEMGGNATYFFQPGIPSRNNPNTPQQAYVLTKELATYHAQALDRLGSFYYSEEDFDDFYYGKGSTYPDVNGAVGILFEQASSRALLRETNNGVLTFGFTVRNQLATSLSTVKGAVAMRTKFLRHQRDFYREAEAVSAANPVKAYLVGLDGDRTRAQALAQLLHRHRIRVYDLASSVDAGRTRFEAGDAYIIPTNQPQTRLLKAMMERVTTFQDSLFYDVSAWTMPLAFGVTHAELRRDPAALLGDEWTDPVMDGGVRLGGEAPYAYLMEWGRYYAPRALYRLQAAGIRVRVAMKPFASEVGGQIHEFSAGTIVIPVTQRDADATVTPAEVHALVEQMVAQDHVRVHAVSTGLTPRGGDLGSPSTRMLDMPRVAILAGAGTSSYRVGEMYHLLTERMRMPVSLLNSDRLANADLSRYNTFIVGHGFYNSLDHRAVDALKQWMQGGGTLIALEAGARWAVQQELVPETFKDLDADTVRIPYGDVPATQGAQQIGGSIFEVELDTTHPLAFGYGTRTPVFRAHEIMLEPSEEAGANVGQYTDAPLLSGYISNEQLERLRGTAALIARRMGRGRAVLFMDNPNFRAFWYGTNGLFMNAIFLGRAF